MNCARYKCLFVLKLSIEPTMTRRLHAGMYANKLTHIGKTLLFGGVIPREGSELHRESSLGSGGDSSICGGHRWPRLSEVHLKRRGP